MCTKGTATLCFVVLSIYAHASLPWKLRSDSDLHIRAVVKVMFFARHYDVSFRRVRPLTKTNLHPWYLNMNFAIISIMVCTGTVWYLNVKTFMEYGLCYIVYICPFRLWRCYTTIRSAAYNCYRGIVTELQLFWRIST